MQIFTWGRPKRAPTTTQPPVLLTPHYFRKIFWKLKAVSSVLCQTRRKLKTVSVCTTTETENRFRREKSTCFFVHFKGPKRKGAEPRAARDQTLRQETFTQQSCSAKRASGKTSTYMLEGVAHAFGFGQTDNDDVLPGAPGTNAAPQQRGSDTGADDDTE